jgi:hypothetical protein
MKMFLAACATGLLLACNNENANNKPDTGTNMNTTSTVNTLTEEEKKEGWQLLFDGSSATGWHKYGGGPVGGSWKITDGAIYLDTSSKIDGKLDAGDIVTDDEFENFQLKLEWKISPKGNSGIMYYVNEDTVKYKKPYESGPEMQIVDNEGHPDGKILKHKAGDLYDLVSCSKETVKPVGEWNLVEIKCVNGKLDFYLNDENVVTTTMWDDNWKKMVAGSKFKEWDGFGTFRKGSICLQDHGDAVSFRNIRIKRL